jgi:hypothetical protein
MSDRIPPGITPREPSLNESIVSLVEETSKVVENTDQTVLVLKRQIEALEEMGASDDTIRDFVSGQTEVNEDLKDQLERTNETLEETEKTPGKISKFLSDGTQKIQGYLSSGTDKLKSSLTSMTNSVGQSLSGVAEQSTGLFLGPAQLLTESFKELTGFDIAGKMKEGISNIGTSIGGKISGAFSSTDKDPERVAPRRNALLKEGGAIGAVGVYLGELLGDTGLGEPQEAEGGFLQNLLGRGGAGGLLSRLGGAKGLASGALRIGGGALFAGLTLSDFLQEGLPAFQSGDIVGGVMNTILGGLAEDDAEVWGDMGKQAAKWGGFGAMVGGPFGALIGAAAGGLVSGIRNAWNLEWDQKSEEFADQAKSVFADENASFFDKAIAGVKYFGQSVLGTMAGGIRQMSEGVNQRISNISEIWQDDDRGLLSKIGGTLFQGISGLVEAPINALRGQLSTAGEYIYNIMPEAWQEKIDLFREGISNFVGNIGESVSGFFGGIRESIFGPRSKERRERFQQFKGRLTNFVGNVGEGINNFLTDVREKGFRQAASSRVSNVIGSIRDFFGNIGESIADFYNDVKEQGLGATIEERINQATEGMDGFFANAARGIGQFFGDVQEKGLGPAVWDRAKEVGESVGEFFSGLGESVMTFLGDATGERGLAGAFEMAGLSDVQRNVIDQLRSTMGEEEANELIKSFGEGKGAFGMNLGMRGSIQEFLNSDRARDFAREEGLRYESVDDAVIKPDGSIIRTSPDDTIIATKSDTTVAGREMQNAYQQVQVTQNQRMMGSDQTQEMINLLGQVRDAINNKPFNNLIQQISQPKMNFDSMRSN